MQDDAAATVGSGATGGAAAYLACLWAHECCRVFCDKMVSQDDKSWIENTIKDIAKYDASLMYLSHWLFRSYQVLSDQ